MVTKPGNSYFSMRDRSGAARVCVKFTSHLLGTRFCSSMSKCPRLRISGCLSEISLEKDRITGRRDIDNKEVYPLITLEHRPMVSNMCAILNIYYVQSCSCLVMETTQTDRSLQTSHLPRGGKFEGSLFSPLGAIE